MFLHAADAVNQGHQRIILRTVDSDVLALATAMVQQLQQVSQNSSLVEKAELSRLSPLHRQHYCSTPRELFTRQAIAGDKHSWSDHICHLQLNGAGCLVQMAGNRFGLIYLK